VQLLWALLAWLPARLLPVVALLEQPEALVPQPQDEPEALALLLAALVQLRPVQHLLVSSVMALNSYLSSFAVVPQNR
jgi:hypothetical protein